LTVTGVVSLAVPPKAGVLLLERSAGEFSVTSGAAVSIVNVRAALVPVFSAASDCSASAV